MNATLHNRRLHFRNTFSNLYSNSLGGGEYALIDDQAAFSFGDGAGNDSPFSVGSWVKRDNNTGNHTIIAKHSSAGSYEWYLYLVGSTCWWGLWKADGTAYMMRTASLADTGSWVHILGTYDGSKTTAGLKIYKNAVQIDNANLTTGVYNGMSNTISKVSLGANGLGGGSFVGKMAHPVVCNKQLSGTEATELYNKKMGDLRTCSFSANLVAAYHFPTGTTDYPTWTDYVGGYNATMQNQESGDIDTDIPT